MSEACLTSYSDATRSPLKGVKVGPLSSACSCLLLSPVTTTSTATTTATSTTTRTRTISASPIVKTNTKTVIDLKTTTQTVTNFKTNTKTVVSVTTDTTTETDFMTLTEVATLVQTVTEVRNNTMMAPVTGVKTVTQLNRVTMTTTQYATITGACPGSTAAITPPASTTDSAVPIITANATSTVSPKTSSTSSASTAPSCAPSSYYIMMKGTGTAEDNALLMATSGNTAAGAAYFGKHPAYPSAKPRAFFLGDDGQLRQTTNDGLQLLGLTQQSYSGINGRVWVDSLATGPADNHYQPYSCTTVGDALRLNCTLPGVSDVTSSDGLGAQTGGNAGYLWMWTTTSKTGNYNVPGAQFYLVSACS